MFFVQIDLDERLIFRFCLYLRPSKTNQKGEIWSILNNGFKQGKPMRRSIFSRNTWPYIQPMMRLGTCEEKGETRLALNDYLEAIARNPESPAQQAYNMAIRILNFYNKDMYNQ